MRHDQRIRAWHRIDDKTEYWHLIAAAWRVGFHWTLMKHHYGDHTSDRWVLQSTSHYDRKRKAAA